MEIKRISNANMNEITRYNLINGDGAAGLSTAAGSALEIQDYIVFESIDVNTNKPKTILSLVTKDGEFFATNSPTCVDAFERICEAFTVLPVVEFYKGRSKLNREYLSCRPIVK